MPLSDHFISKHHKLEQTSLACLRGAKILAESGSRSLVLHEFSKTVAEGLGAEFLGMRVGYASLAITVAHDKHTTSRMIDVGHHRVNHQIDQAVRKLAVETTTRSFTPEEFEAAIDRIVRETPRHHFLFVALAVGLACASFGELFGMDNKAYVPVLIAAGCGQLTRHTLFHRSLNVYVVAAIVAFVAATLAGLGSMLVGSATVNLAMTAAILLLVPGVPATNAQTDILDGYPTMGSSRAVSVVMTMIFVATGFWLAEALLGVTL